MPNIDKHIPLSFFNGASQGDSLNYRVGEVLYLNQNH